MKTKSNGPSSFASVSSAGASRSSILCSTPAFFQAPRERGPLGVDVAAQHAAIRGQRERDREGAVAGERADFQAALGADRLHEKRHELSLVGADLHPGMGIRRRGFAQLAQHSGFAHRVLDDVARQLFWKERMPARHQTRNSLYAGLRVSSAYG